VVGRDVARIGDAGADQFVIRRARLCELRLELCWRATLSFSLGHLIELLVVGLEPGRKLALPLGLLLGYPIFMVKSIKDTPKKRRGRPSTGGRRKGVMVRLKPAQFDELDIWIKKRAPAMSRPEAIRRLVELGLKVKK
jgi:hypothetical protein